MTNEDTRKQRPAFLTLLPTVLFLVLLLIFPSAVSDGIRSGLAVAYQNVIPAVLPFMIASDLFTTLDLEIVEHSIGRLIGAIFHVSPLGGTVILIGIFGGFPIGARLCADLTKSGRISPGEAEGVLLCSSIASPAFVVTGVGTGMLQNTELGIKLYVIVLLSHFLCALLIMACRKNTEFRQSSAIRLSRRFSIADAIEEAGASSLKIASCIAFFSGCSCILQRLIPDQLLSATISALLEIGSGSISAINVGGKASLPLLAFCISFSGLSVYLQIKSFAEKAEIPTRTYFLGKLLSGIVAAMISLLSIS